jgi:tRNA(fMet)-specific endonuclease VapC
MYVIDTDIAVAYLRGERDILRFVLSLGKFYTTVTTIAELSYGLHNSKNPKKHARKLLEFIKGTELLGVGLPTSISFGEIKSRLKEGGNLIGDFDTLIASSCIVHDCTLITRNKKHFEKIPGLRVMEV